MADRDKSSRDPVLERKYLSFLKERIARCGVINIGSLTGHLSAIPAATRNQIGTSLSSLRSFIKGHPEVFQVDKYGDVRLAKKQGSNSAENSFSKPLEEDRILGSPSELSDGLPKELFEVLGKVYRIFQAYGFIRVTYPVVCSVYFSINCFKTSEEQDKNGAIDISVGEAVYLNARKGPGNVEAQYRATEVWRADPVEIEGSTTRTANLTSKASTSKQSAQREIEGTGKVHNLFGNYGFISQNKSLKDNIFFKLGTLNKPGCTSLDDVLKLGDVVYFHAVPTVKKGSLVHWQATKVWMDDQDNCDNNDIFYSSPENSISSGSQEKLNLRSTALSNVNTSSREEPENHLNCHEQKSNSYSKIVEKSICKSSKNSLTTKPIVSTTKSTVSSKTGSILPLSQRTASINFDNNQKALVLADVFYSHGDRIENFLWEVNDGQEVHFDAVKDSSWSAEYSWKVTLAWIGFKPDVSSLNLNKLKELSSHIQGTVESVERFLEPVNAYPGIEDGNEDFVEETFENGLITDDKGIGSDNQDKHAFSALSTDKINDIFDRFVETVAVHNKKTEEPLRNGAENLPAFHGSAKPKTSFSSRQINLKETRKPLLGNSPTAHLRQIDVGPPSKQFTSNHKESTSWAVLDLEIHSGKARGTRFYCSSKL